MTETIGLGHGESHERFGFFCSGVGRLSECSPSPTLGRAHSNTGGLRCVVTLIDEYRDKPSSERGCVPYWGVHRFPWVGAHLSIHNITIGSIS